ncbi:MAG: type IVB secretion system protein IcmH/DotU [Betaproteobacteria bacterium]
MSGPGNEPADADATIVLPTPGKRRSGPFASYLDRQASAADLSALGGLNALVEAANPILAVVPQIRHALRHPDPAGLRARLRAQVESFEHAARAAGLPEAQIDGALFALCALLDDSAQATPWGRAWESLVAELHGEKNPGEKLFALLDELSAQPAANIDLLEFCYVCLALGFEGRYRAGGEGGRQALMQTRVRLYETLERERPRHAHELSEAWRGTGTRARRVSGPLALWGAACACVLFLAALYFGFSVSLGQRSDPVARELARLKPPPVAAPARTAAKGAPSSAPVQTKALAEALGEKDVDVSEIPGGSMIVLRSDRLFASGSARLDGALRPLIERIAGKLDALSGVIVVAGHTDDVPIRTARYPSNFELSTERAKSVSALMATRLKDPARLRAEGVGDAEPLVPNDSAASRARNRRVSIVLKGAS